jgi:hypothetical protein
MRETKTFTQLGLTTLRDIRLYFKLSPEEFSTLFPNVTVASFNGECPAEYYDIFIEQWEKLKKRLEDTWRDGNPTRPEFILIYEKEYPSQFEKALLIEKIINIWQGRSTYQSFFAITDAERRAASTPSSRPASTSTYTPLDTSFLASKAYLQETRSFNTLGHRTREAVAQYLRVSVDDLNNIFSINTNISVFSPKYITDYLLNEKAEMDSFYTKNVKDSQTKESLLLMAQTTAPSVYKHYTTLDRIFLNWQRQ